MVERPSPEHKIGVQRERRDPVRMILQRVKEFAAICVPNPYSPIAGCCIQNSLAVHATTTPANHIYAGSVPTQCVLDSTGSTGMPDADCSVL
jgi:hypothetical protein